MCCIQSLAAIKAAQLINLAAAYLAACRCHINYTEIFIYVFKFPYKQFLWFAQLPELVDVM
jgi:hypothetical protein